MWPIIVNRNIPFIRDVTYSVGTYTSYLWHSTIRALQVLNLVASMFSSYVECHLVPSRLCDLLLFIYN